MRDQSLPLSIRSGGHGMSGRLIPFDAVMLLLQGRTATGTVTRHHRGGGTHEIARDSWQQSRRRDGTYCRWLWGWTHMADPRLWANDQLRPSAEAAVKPGKRRVGKRSDNWQKRRPRSDKDAPTNHHSARRIGSERTRRRPRAIETIAPTSRSSVTSGRFAASNAACWSGTRRSAERSSTTDGRSACDVASSSPKSVSADTITCPDRALTCRHEQRCPRPRQ